jgi:hypothetical protein
LISAATPDYYAISLRQAELMPAPRHCRFHCCRELPPPTLLFVIIFATPFQAGLIYIIFADR